MKTAIVLGLLMTMIIAAWSQPIDIENVQLLEQENIKLMPFVRHKKDL